MIEGHQQPEGLLEFLAHKKTAPYFVGCPTFRVQFISAVFLLLSGHLLESGFH